MTMRLAVDGVAFEQWESSSLTMAMNALASGFSFTAVATDFDRFPVRRGAPVTVLVDDVTMLTGFAEKLNISHDSESHSFSVSGRDATCDIIDSTLDGSFVFQGSISLETIIKRVMAYLGMAGKVINSAGAIKPFTPSDINGAEVGEGCFDFIMRMARKRQVLIATDGLGNVVLQRASTVPEDIKLFNEIAGTRNNIKSASIDYDESAIFAKYVLHSQANEASASNGGEALDWDAPATTSNAPAGKVGRSGQAVNSSVRASRILHKKADGSLDNGQCRDRAKWESAHRRANSFTYSCVVAGHSYAPGKIWRPNILVPVVDEFAEIAATLLLSEVTLNIDNSGGSTASLKLIAPEAFSLDQQAETERDEPKVKKAKKGQKDDAPLVWKDPK